MKKMGRKKLKIKGDMHGGKGIPGKRGPRK